MPNRLTKTELKNLRKMLPPGSLGIIAQQTGLAESSVYQVLCKPERYNQNVIGIAISIGEKYKEEFIEIKNKLKAIS